MPVIALRNASALADPKVKIDRDKFVLSGISVIEQGPAIGHGFEVDGVMLQQVAEQINATPKGVKSRLTHPGLVECGGHDGIEVTLGRVRNARVDGDRVRADLHMGQFAAVTPQGDLRAYLLAIAEEDPELVGMSIVFDPDQFDERVVTEERPEARPTEDGNFIVRFGRSKAVMAGDMVGDPAANTSGLLSRLPKQIVNGITPELLERWADDLKNLNQPHEAGEKPVPDQGESNMNPKLRSFLESKGLKAGSTDEQALAFANVMQGADAEEVKRLTAGGESPVPTGGGVAVAELEAAKAKAAEEMKLAEADRVREIRALASDTGLGDTWACERILAGDSVDNAKTLALKAWKQENEDGPSVTGGDDLNLSSIGPAMTDAILLRAGVEQFEEEEVAGRPQIKRTNGERSRRAPHERAKEFRGLSLVDMARQHLRAMGGTDTERLSKTQVLNRLGPRSFRRAYPGLAQSSSDFDSILQDAVHKTFRSLYLDIEPTWPIWARFITNPDFKTINRAALSESPNMVERGEGGEVRYVTLTDSKESYALVEYTGGIILTRRAIINDDLDAFSRIPRLQAAAARRKEEDVAYAVITDNAAMSDGVALFHSGHANLVGSGAVPSVASLTLTEALLMKQTGPKGAAVLELRGRFLLVPIELFRTTQQLVASQSDPAKSNEAINPFFNEQMKIVPSKRLSDNSTTAWYELADYRDGQIDTVEVGFLEGEAVPVLKQETDFDTEDQKYKVNHTVAAKAIDHRGMVKNPGT